LIIGKVDTNKEGTYKIDNSRGGCEFFYRSFNSILDQKEGLIDILLGIAYKKKKPIQPYTGISRASRCL